MSIQDTLQNTTVRTTRIESTLIDIDSTRSVKWTFPNIRFQVSPQVTVYTRDIGNGIISAHPNGTVHGSAYGESATEYGNWTQVAQSSQGELTRGGRASIVDALAGNTGAFTRGSIGSGESVPTVEDDSLDNLSGEVSASSFKSGSNKSTTRSLFSFYQHKQDVSEFGIVDDEGRFVARLTTDQITPSLEKEVRIDVEFTYSGNSTGGGVVTDQAEEALAESVVSVSDVVGLNQFALGKGDAEPSTSDVDLDEEVIVKDAIRQVAPESIGVESVFLQEEPSGQQPFTVTEAGVKDSEDRLIWRTLMEGVEKTDDIIIQSLAQFRVV